MRTKYHNRKVRTGGQTYASKKESRRARELELMQAAGKIADLRQQVKYVLIPAQREPDWIDYSKSKRGRKVRGALLEHECAYVADFVYQKDGETVVEDTKGFRTKDYVIKRKLMLWVHGIRVKEV